MKILKLKNNIIILISLIFSITVGLGFYGFGPDFYHTYSKSNLTWGGWNDMLGYRISTLTFFEKNYGVNIVSFMLALSTGIMLRGFLKSNNKNNTFLFLIIYILILHTWPIIMSTSNAMRQGLSMSMIFISFAYLIEQKTYRSFFFIFLSIFFHKSGIFFFFIFIQTFLISFLRYFKSSTIFYGIFIFILVVSNIIAFSILFHEHEPSKIVGKDNRFLLALFFLVYIFLFNLKFKYMVHKKINLFLYIFGFSTLPMIYFGFNWEYERMIMMVIIPLILIFCELLSSKKILYLYLIFFFILLLVLTILFGQYSSLS